MNTEIKQLPDTIEKRSLSVGQRGIVVDDIETLWRLSCYIEASGLAPKGIEKKEAIFTAIQLGLELGITPMAALQNIAVINGRPGIYGDAALALVRASGLLEDYSEEMTGSGDERRCIVTSKRRGMSARLQTAFSVSDAKRAGLWGKQGPWSQYPDRMLKFRARGFNLRDNFGDVLKGLSTTEELRDMPSIEVETAKVQVFAPPTQSNDARAEAQAGLAPEITPEPELGKPQPNFTPQELFSKRFIEEGITFDEFSAWAVQTGQMERDKYDSFEVMPGALVVRLKRAQDRIVEDILKTRQQSLM